MSQQEREELLEKIQKLPEAEQNIILGAAQMAVMLNEMKGSSSQKTA